MVKEPYACLWLPTHCYTPKREQTPNKKWPPVTPKKNTIQECCGEGSVPKLL